MNWLKKLICGRELAALKRRRTFNRNFICISSRRYAFMITPIFRQHVPPGRRGPWLAAFHFYGGRETEECI